MDPPLLPFPGPPRTPGYPWRGCLLVLAFGLLFLLLVGCPLLVLREMGRIQEQTDTLKRQVEEMKRGK